MRHVRKLLVILLLLLCCAKPFALAEEARFNRISFRACQMLETETVRIMESYCHMSEEAFSDFLQAQMISREKPYFSVNGNLLWFGDRYHGSDFNHPYHGITQLIWNNNDVPIQPLYNIEIGASLETVCSLLIDNGVFPSADEIPIQRQGPYQSIELDVPASSAVAGVDFQYIWIFELTDGVLQRIVYCVTHCWEPSDIGVEHRLVPITLDETPLDVSGYVYQNTESPLVILPVVDVLNALGIRIDWENSYEGIFEYDALIYHVNPEQHTIWTELAGEREALLYWQDAAAFRERYQHRQRFGSYGRHLFADLDTCRSLFSLLGYEAEMNEGICLTPLG